MDLLREKLDELAFGERVGSGGLALNSRHVAAIGEARLAWSGRWRRLSLGRKWWRWSSEALDAAERGGVGWESRCRRTICSGGFFRSSVLEVGVRGGGNGILLARARRVGKVRVHSI